MMQITIEDAWMSLASSVLDMAVSDVEKFHSQKEIKQQEMSKPYYQRNYNRLIKEDNYKTACDFLASSYADYLLEMVLWWSNLRGQIYVPKQLNIRG